MLELEPQIRGPSVPRRCFDALLASVEPSETYLRALRALGYEGSGAEEGYPLELWRQALDLSRGFFFPELSEEEGFRELGKLIALGLSRTELGSVVTASLEGLSPEGILRRLPLLMPLGREGLSLEIRAIGERRWLGEVSDDLGFPEFTASVIEAALRCAGPRAHVRVRQIHRHGYQLLFSW